MVGIKPYLLKSNLSLLLLLVACASESKPTLQDSLEISSWSVKNLIDGPTAIVVGAAAPAVCGIYFTGNTLTHLEGQGALAIPFLPFVTTFGIITGTVRGIIMLGVGTADTITGGAFLLSEPYLDFSMGLGQWCACLYSNQCRENSKLETEGGIHGH